MALFNLCHYDKALELFNKLLELNPNYDKAYLNKGWSVVILGVLLNRLSQFEEAILCFDKAIAINSKYDEAYYSKGNLN